MDIAFGPELTGNFEESSRREWLETNGIGGFASGTVAGVNTRRYHSLLIAATVPPLGRVVMVSQIFETLSFDGKHHELGTAQYPGTVHPRGYEHLAAFRLDPCPTWVYRIGDIVLEKSIMAIHGENTTVVSYFLREAPGRVQLTLRPALACRDYHQLRKETPEARAEAAVQPGLLTFQPFRDVVPVHIGHPAGDWHAESFWYRNTEYLRELDRGLEFREDLLSPGKLVLSLERDYRASLVISTKPLRSDVASDLEENERARRAELNEGVSDHLTYWLRRAADGFIARRGHGGRTVIAGYPWFTDWGRDTFISLPGLTLTTGRADVAREILETFGRHLDNGLIPNRFPDAGEAPEYNTVDASLWYVWAAERTFKANPDRDFARRVLDPAVQAIVRGYRSGTRFGIRMAEDGLITQGAAGVALTWMDARIGTEPVTPRHGKPVEINALWYNALSFAADLAETLRGPGEARELRRTAALVRAAFQNAFWYEQGGYLYDVIDGLHRDASLRPNQIIALAMPRPLLPPEKAKSVLAVVERELVTPLGLRSLGPKEKGYRPRYEGDWAQRDACYHQGTVWAWLIGPYATALANVHGRTPETRARLEELLVPFRDQLSEGGLGTISEIFDGDQPHRPVGCISQAWSVAEVLRVMTDELS